MKKEYLAIVLAAGLAVPVLAPRLTTAATPAPVKLADADDDNLPGIVKGAKKVFESNKEGTYKAPEKGQVWLYDTNEHNVVHSISIKDGGTYAFNTSQDRVYVNGKEGASVSLTPKHIYRIYYVSAAVRDKNGKADAKSMVPDTAKLVAEGKGKDLVYKAASEGIVYLWDNTENELVNTFHVLKNQVLAIEPERNRVALEDKVILKDADLKTTASYRLLFDAKN